jgi:hypothetical protein
MATIIDQDVTVNIGEGSVVIEQPGYNERVFLKALAEKSEDDQVEWAINKVVAVNNLVRKDGSPITVEDLKARKFSYAFGVYLFVQIVKSITSFDKIFGNEGNVPTGA